MTSPIGLIQQVALGDQVADALRRLIVSGELAAGTRLVEIPLAEQFGVSRGPIREAFVRLESEGLLTTGRRGAFVVGMTDDDIDELYSLRETIEQFAVGLIVARRADLDWPVLEAAVARMQEAAQAGITRSSAGPTSASTPPSTNSPATGGCWTSGAATRRPSRWCSTSPDDGAWICWRAPPTTPCCSSSCATRPRTTSTRRLEPTCGTRTAA